MPLTAGPILNENVKVEQEEESEFVHKRSIQKEGKTCASG